MAYLDKTGLTYFWSKIKAKLNEKAEKGHTHTEYVSINQVEEMFAAFAKEYLDDRKIRVLDLEDDRTGKFGDGYITIVKEPMHEDEEW